MTRWILIVCLCLATLAAPRLVAADDAAPTYTLTCAHVVGELTRGEVQMQVGGDLTLREEGKVRRYPLSVVSEHRFQERVLYDAGASLRTVRHYDQATATIKIDKGGEKPALAAEHETIVAVRKDNQVDLSPLTGNLSRDELDLIEITGRSLLLDGLLPTEPVTIGATWKPSDEAVAALMGLDVVSSNKVEITLTEVVGGQAHIRIAGKVQGMIAAANSTLEIKARLHLHVDDQRVTWLAVAVKEKREIGPVSPGLDVNAKWSIKLAKGEASEALSDAVAEAAQNDRADAALLAHTAARGEFSLLHDRRWYVTQALDDVTIFRMCDDNQLIAQCNVSPIKAVSPETPPGLEQFQDQIKQALGKSFGQFLKAKQGMEGGRRVFRVVVKGEVSELPIQWMYYLLTDRQGRQVALVFTLEDSLVERFARADQPIVHGLKIESGVPQTAGRQVEAK